jgi:hypothetical protein
MQKAQHPNKLRALLREAGLTVREIHRETTIPESTIYYWAAGHGVIPKEDRLTLARVIGCFPHDLAPYYDISALHQADVEKACTYAEEVVALTASSASGFLRHSVLKLQQQFTPFASIEAVRKLNQHIASLA